MRCEKRLGATALLTMVLSAVPGPLPLPQAATIQAVQLYMHDGSLPTLDAVVDFYYQGGRANPHLDLEMRRRQFTTENRIALVAFLRSLSGEVREGWK